MVPLCPLGETPREQQYGLFAYLLAEVGLAAHQEASRRVDRSSTICGRSGRLGSELQHNTADQMLVMRTLIESARAAREPLFCSYALWISGRHMTPSKGLVVA